MITLLGYFMKDICYQCFDVEVALLSAKPSHVLRGQSLNGVRNLSRHDSVGLLGRM
jgi:hypothetical protein